MAPIHRAFEWDDEKAASNARKHGITFDDAAAVLSDPDGDRFHRNESDPRHDEPRTVTIASDPDDRGGIYVIVWTDRSEDDGQVTRIISARFANQRERRRYVDRNQP